MELATIERPERSFFWTEPVASTGEMVTEDPLGLDYVSQQVGLLLLPTLTTRSTRAQAYAMVLYGLRLAELAVERFHYPNTEDTRRELFERWERFWALATLEFREGNVDRGDSDAMRGIRGAKSAWKAGASALPLDFDLISRQQELGQLGAYLAPLRRSELVVDGDIKWKEPARAIIECFWDEIDNAHVRRYEEFALEALEPGRKSIERASGRLTLVKVGERSRLSSLRALNRKPQQARLYKALFENARDPHTLSVAQFVETASRAGARGPRAVLDGAIDGRFGALSRELHDLLVTARAFGGVMQGLLATFDRVYVSVHRGGWVVAKEEVVSAAMEPGAHSSLQRACRDLLGTPTVDAIRRFPMHGRAFLQLTADLLSATPGEALDLLLAYHSRVQRDRRRGSAWLREEAGKLVLNVTSYSAHPDAARFPSFKLDAVRSLLIDLGRVEPSVAASEVEVAP